MAASCATQEANQASDLGNSTESSQNDLLEELDPPAVAEAVPAVECNSAWLLAEIESLPEQPVLPFLPPWESVPASYDRLARDLERSCTQQDFADIGDLPSLGEYRPGLVFVIWNVLKYRQNLGRHFHEGTTQCGAVDGMTTCTKGEWLVAYSFTPQIGSQVELYRFGLTSEPGGVDTGELVAATFQEDPNQAANAGAFLLQQGVDASSASDLCLAINAADGLSIDCP
jgi:hypothetical protein